MEINPYQRSDYKCKKSCRISVADGTVEVSQDISNGSVSRVSSVLSSLGHDPDIGWLRVVGIGQRQGAPGIAWYSLDLL